MNGNFEQTESAKVSVQTSKELGRYLVAEQEYFPRDLILQEYPIVACPSGQYDWNAEKDEPYLVCVGCFLSLTELSCGNSDASDGDDSDGENEGPIYYNCDNCQWPFCSKKCFLMDTDHRQMECEIFKRKKIRQNVQSLLSIYFIRCLHLSQKDSGRWSQILNLSELYDGDCTRVIGGKNFSIFDYLQENIYDEKNNTSASQKISTDIISRLNRIRNVNAFQINYNQFDDKRYYGMVLYSSGSMAAHSCSPNCRWKTSLPSKNFDNDDKERGYPIRFEAVKNIKKGHSITIAYRNRCLTQGTLTRRRELWAAHRFRCQCERCGDATEFQTFFSSVHCTHCDLGYLLPQNSFDDKSDWICRTCHGSENVNFVLEIVERITAQIIKAKEGRSGSGSGGGGGGGGGCRPTEICWKLDTIIKKYGGRILHPNNYLIVWAEFVWLQYLEYHLLFSAGASKSIKYDTFLLMTQRALHCNSIYSQFFSTSCRFYGYFQKLIGVAHYLYYLSPSIWEALTDDQRLRAMRKTLEYFENSLKYDGWESQDLQFIDCKLRHIKSTVTAILGRMGKCAEKKKNDKQDKIVK